ncbi:MAG: PQQ-binding-like beta-propeller repeat protein [Alphaproteobacteria bacterium]|nr:PQQ-binding-like beta-propeller repeat protein [Alphaproteobacteria bacterium]
MFKFKTFGLLCLITVLASCGIFSNKKEIPQGERISVLDLPAQKFASTSKAKSFDISKPVQNADWSQTAGNAAHLTKNIAVNTEPKELWTADFGKGTSKRNLLLASPIIFGNNVYAQDVNGTVYAFDLKSGKQIFKTKLKPFNENDASSAMNGAGLAAYKDYVYAATGFGGLFALDKTTGAVVWSKDLNTLLRVAPSVAGGKLFVQTIDNRLFCLDAKDGSDIWDFSISAEDTVLAGGSVPAYDAANQIVVAAFSNGEIQAFNARIGYPLWSNNLINEKLVGSSLGINAVKASPVIDGNVVYAVGSNGLMLAISLESGDVLWKAPIGGTNTPLVDSQSVFVLSDNLELFALDKKTGDVLYKKELLREFSHKKRRNLIASGPVMFNSELYITTSLGTIYVFDAKTGVQKQTIDISSPIAFAPIAAQKTMIITTDNAKLIAFE